MKDERIFRVTFTNGAVRYGNRISASGMCGGNGQGKGMGRTIRKVEATNREATEGWTDVTVQAMPWRGSLDDRSWQAERG